jgi:hypothetical protein
MVERCAACARNFSWTVWRYTCEGCNAQVCAGCRAAGAGGGGGGECAVCSPPLAPAKAPARRGESPAALPVTPPRHALELSAPEPRRAVPRDQNGLIGALVPPELILGGDAPLGPGFFDGEEEDALRIYSPIIGRGCSVWTCMNCRGAFMCMSVAGGAGAPLPSPVRAGSGAASPASSAGTRYCSKTCHASAVVSGAEVDLCA